MSEASALQEAFAYCEERARRHYENFPVAAFVPKDKRPYVYALYAFMRTADDFADEPAYEGVRAEKLDEWQQRLDAAYAGNGEGPIFLALAETVRQLAIPKALLADLLSAFRQDTVKRRYATWDELLDYCRRSANPVGRLVLLAFGYDDADLARYSDRICTGLQLANHWQDVAIDLAKDRIYVPAERMSAHGVTEQDLKAGHVSEPIRALMRDLVSGARALFEQGRPLCDRVGSDLRFEMRLTWLAGSAILDRIEAAGFDVFDHRPQHGKLDKAALAWRAWRWKTARP